MTAPLRVDRLRWLQWFENRHGQIAVLRIHEAGRAMFRCSLEFPDGFAAVEEPAELVGSIESVKVEGRRLAAFHGFTLEVV